jgi:uncharacterized membrane protein YphA (DoxX/SURF4 family)
MSSNLPEQVKRSYLVLRGALAFAFAYAAISAFITPSAWVGYLPGFVFDLPIPATTLLALFGVGEIILALWLLSGRQTFIASVIAFFLLIAIPVLHLEQMSILFRDVALAMVALALAVWNWPYREKQEASNRE